MLGSKFQPRRVSKGRAVVQHQPHSSTVRGRGSLSTVFNLRCLPTGRPPVARVQDAVSSQLPRARRAGKYGAGILSCAKLLQPDADHSQLIAIHVIHTGSGTLLGHLPSLVPGVGCAGQVALDGSNGGGRTPVIGRIGPLWNLFEQALGFPPVPAMESFDVGAIHGESMSQFAARMSYLAGPVQPRKCALPIARVQE